MNLNGLPRYRCHKEVRAVKIHRIDTHLDTVDAVVVPEDGFAPIPVSARFLWKHEPEAGGYLVLYDDGYVSYSPAEPFEKGYSLIDQA